MLMQSCRVPNLPTARRFKFRRKKHLQAQPLTDPGSFSWRRISCRLKSVTCSWCRGVVWNFTLLISWSLLKLRVSHVRLEPPRNEPPFGLKPKSQCPWRLVLYCWCQGLLFMSNKLIIRTNTNCQSTFASSVRESLKCSRSLFSLIMSLATATASCTSLFQHQSPEWY